MSTKISNRFYHSIGKLFYAVASADQVIRQEEIQTLRKIIRDEWLKVDEAEDEFGSDAAFQIEVVFDWLMDNEYSSMKSFNEFKLFKHEHPGLFSATINNLLIQTCSKIAGSFSGVNKKEADLLSEVNALLHS